MFCLLNIDDIMKLGGMYEKSVYFVFTFRIRWN